MQIIYSKHSLQRLKQRAITQLEVRHILEHPTKITNSDELKIIEGQINERNIKIVAIQTKTYIKIITVM